jgi:phosphoesterase RecJ-like protein
MTVPDSLDALREALLAAERIVLSTHIRPDGDALGSEIAVARFLQALGKEVAILNADPEPRVLSWLADEQPKGLIQVYQEGSLKQSRAVAEADAVMVVDTGAAHRLGPPAALLQSSPGRKLLLDHHPDPERWFDVTCVDTSSAATGELVYDLIAGHDPALLDAAVATALYTAIVTDTGSFRYSATTPRTHRIIADLLERGGIESEPIHIAVYDGRTREGLRLLARSLDTITTHYDGRLASMYVTQAMLRETGAYFDETEGLISYALALEGVLAAVIFLETPSAVKISFRSKGECPVNGWAAKFGGGGHANASGAYLTGRPLHHVMKEVIDKTPAHIVAAPGAEAEGEASEDEIARLAALFNQKL